MVFFVLAISQNFLHVWFRDIYTTFISIESSFCNYKCFFLFFSQFSCFLLIIFDGLHLQEKDISSP